MIIDSVISMISLRRELRCLHSVNERHHFSATILLFTFTSGKCCLSLHFPFSFGHNLNQLKIALITHDQLFLLTRTFNITASYTQNLCTSCSLCSTFFHRKHVSRSCLLPSGSLLIHESTTSISNSYAFTQSELAYSTRKISSSKHIH